MNQYRWIIYPTGDGMTEEKIVASGSGPGIKQAIVVAIIVIGAIGGIIIMNNLMEPDIDPNEISATLVIDYGDGIVEWYNVTTVNNSVPGLLAEAIGADNYNLNRSDFGVDYIFKINGILLIFIYI